MLDFLIATQATETITFTGTLATLFSSLFLGAMISFLHMYTHRQNGYKQAFTVSLIMLPAVVAIIILLVGSNVARAFSLAGAFSLIRFRSTPGDSQDISNVFFTLAVGLACGMGYYGYAIVFTLTIICVMLILDKLHFGQEKNTRLALKITIPEDMEYHGMFDTIFTTYCKRVKLQRVRTREFGTLYELGYVAVFKDEADIQPCIDDIRKLNGNLKVEVATYIALETSF